MNHGTRQLPADGKVGELAAQMRQALQTCSVHTVGPLAAFERCTLALEDGQIDAEQFQQIGWNVIAVSQERLRSYEAEAEGERPENSRKISRERRLIAFTDALFGLGLREKEG